MSLAGRFGVLDHPGGHKQHETSTPFVGGFGVIFVVLATIWYGLYFDQALPTQALIAVSTGAFILFITGFADDIWHLNFKTRFVIQAVVAISMVTLGRVELHTLGQLLPGVNLELSVLAIPLTIFATVGLINALNMIDGIDGLSGSVSFISLAGIAVVAWLAMETNHLYFVVAVMGAIGGFLYFNLRYPTNRRARVFLGDNGSMLLGFLFAWLLIDLSQGEKPAMTPVTALWIFGVPLLDTVCVMLRRIWLGKTPFHADRNHLHHLFIRAGFRVSDTVWIISLMQVLLVAIGIGGLRLGLPEYLMFALFIGAFGLYAYAIFRPWRLLPNLRKLNAMLGFPSVHARGVFVGYFSKEASQEILASLADDLSGQYDYRLSLHRVDSKSLGKRNVFALIETEGDMDERSIGEIRRLMLRIKAHLSGRSDIRVRFFMHRDNDNDPRPGKQSDTDSESFAPDGERRTAVNGAAFYSLQQRREHKAEERQIAQV